jgi:hypothetical protein
LRWFKHLAAAHQDEDMAEIISTLGVEGYGTWWIILEVIAGQMDSTDKCSARYSAKKWGNFCGFSAKKFQKICGKLAEISSISVELSGEFLEIECRNLLKYRDEYSRKSGQCQDNIRPKIQKQNIDTETERERESEKNKTTHALVSVFIEKLKKLTAECIGPTSITPALLSRFQKWETEGRDMSIIEDAFLAVSTYPYLKRIDILIKKIEHPFETPQQEELDPDELDRMVKK